MQGGVRNKVKKKFFSIEEQMKAIFFPHPN